MMLTQTGLLIHGEHVPLLSGEMHFWRIRKDLWEPCLNQVKASGLPIVSTYLSWRRHCIGPNEHDLSGRTDSQLDLPEFLELCESIGLWVHLKPGPWICAEETNGGYPDWLVADKELQVLDSGGQPVLGYNYPFQSPIPSYMHPRYLEYIRVWLTDVDAVIREYCYPEGPIVMIQLDNEPSMTFHDRMFESDYNQAIVGAGGLYQQWMQTKYGTVKELNRFYKTATETFETIQAPRSQSIRSLIDLRRYADWVEFKEYLLARYIETVREIHIANGIRNTLFTVNYNKHDPLAVPNNWSQLEQASGLGGFDCYIEFPLDFADLVDISMAANYSLAVSKLPWAPEMMAGIWKMPEREINPIEIGCNEFEYLYFLALAFGLRGMNFYMMVNRENWVNAPVDEEGRPTPTFPAPLKVVNLLERVPDFFDHRNSQQVAVLYYRPYAREAYIVEGKHVDVAGYTLGLPYFWFRRLYTELLKLNYDPGIVDPWVKPDQLQQFSLVFVPSGLYMDRTTQQNLVDYTSGGGTVVFLPDFPQMDLDFNLWHVSEVAGVERGGNLSEGGVVFHGIGLGQFVVWHPATGFGGESETARFIEDLQGLLIDRKLEPAVHTNTPDVILRIQYGQGSAILFIINSAVEAKEVSLRFRKIRTGKLVPILNGSTGKFIQHSCANLSTPGRTAQAFFIEEYETLPP
ncbi:MAG: beta-galactosidase [Anaerolineales bacterium]